MGQIQSLFSTYYLRLFQGSTAATCKQMKKMEWAKDESSSPEADFIMNFTVSDAFLEIPAPAVSWL